MLLGFFQIVKKKIEGVQKKEMNMSYFSKKLKELRKEKSLTASQMEDALGLSGGSWSRYERSLTMPSLSVALKIANYFGVSLDELVGKNADLAHIGVMRLRHAEERLGREEFQKAWLVAKKASDLVSVDDPETRNENMKVIDMIVNLLHGRRTSRPSVFGRIRPE